LPRILARVAAIAAAALMLAGCIISDHDVSAELQPQFPLTAKSYRDVDGKVTVFTVAGNAYLAREGDEPGNRVRFFKIPEYAGYVFQFEGSETDAQAHKTAVVYGYFLADVSATGFVLRDWEKQATDHIPAHLSSLVTIDNENNLTLKDGRRDTLYVIRELARANLPTKSNVYTAADEAK
jgi:hypothetical protein